MRQVMQRGQSQVLATRKGARCGRKICYWIHFYNHENDYRLLIWKLGCDQVSFIFMYRNHVIFSV